MLQANAPRHKSPTPALLPQPADSAEPPIVSGVATPHPIWGRTPMGRHGFTLDRQSIHMLAHWHRKAVRYVSTMPAGSEDVWLPEVQQIIGDLYEAVLNYKPRSGRDAAWQFQAILSQIEHDETITSIGLDEFQSLVEGLIEATKGPEPTKRVGDLSRDGRLTRAGLLHRYHAFLIGELQTVSWNLYGEPQYATVMVPIDSEVNRRTRDGFKDGKPLDYDRRRKHCPFFDESKLTARAKAVLGSLSISTTKPDRR